MNIIEKFKTIIRKLKGEIEELNYETEELSRSADLWYNKCLEYEKILFDLGLFKIKSNDKPF